MDLLADAAAAAEASATQTQRQSRRRLVWYGGIVVVGCPFEASSQRWQIHHLHTKISNLAINMVFISSVSCLSCASFYFWGIFFCFSSTLSKNVAYFKGDFILLLMRAADTMNERTDGHVRQHTACSSTRFCTIIISLDYPVGN